MADFDARRRLSSMRLTPDEEYALLLALMEKTSPKPSPDHFAFVPLADFYREVDASYELWNKFAGLSSGLPSLDAMTLGFQAGELTVIGGATSQGKTALALNVAAHVAREHHVLFVTLEMTQVQVGTRLKRIDPLHFPEVGYHFFFQKEDELSWRHVDGLVERAVTMAGVELVVIDHLHYFSREIQNASEDLGNITKEFKKNAIRHNIPIILISHTRKAADSHTRKTGINDLRGSSYIAQDADVVLMVERSVEGGQIAVTLEKNRNREGNIKVGETKVFAFKETKITEIVKEF